MIISGIEKAMVSCHKCNIAKCTECNSTKTTAAISMVFMMIDCTCRAKVFLQKLLRVSSYFKKLISGGLE